MTDTNNNDGQSFELCVVNQPELKFSEVKKAMAERRLKMDVPGCLLAADGEGACSHVETDKEDEYNSHVFRMAGNACSRLVVEAMASDPAAWAVLAEWHARNLQKKAKREALDDLLGCLAND